MAEVQGSKIEFFDYRGNTEEEMGSLSYLSGYVEDGKEIVGINIKNAENTIFYDTSMIKVKDSTFKMPSINDEVLKKGDVTATLILKDESGQIENIESSISYFPSDINYEVISNTSFMKGFVYISGLATNVEEGTKVEVTLEDKEGNFIKSPIEVNSENEWATYIDTRNLIGNDLSYAVNYEGVDPSYFDYKKIKVVDDYAKNIDIKIDDYNSSDENVSISGNVVIQGYENKIIITDTNRKEIIELDESNINPDGSFTLENIDLSLFNNGKIIVQLEVVNGENKSLYGEVIEKNIIVNPEVEFTHKELISNILYLEGKVDPSLEGKYINISVNIPEIELSQVLIKEGGLWEYKEYITESIGLNVTAYVSDPSYSYMTNLGSLPASLIVRGNYYDFSSSEFDITDSKYGASGGHINLFPNVREGHEIVRLSFTDGNKEFSFNPPFDPEQVVFSTTAYGFRDTTLIATLEVKDAEGNVTIVKNTIEKGTYGDNYNHLYEAYIEDGILYVSGQETSYGKGWLTTMFVSDESGKEIKFFTRMNGKGYWESYTDVSSLTDGVISINIEKPFISHYQYSQDYTKIEVGTLESSAKAQVQIEDNDNILTEDENINISGTISKNSTIEKLVLTDGNKEVELTDVDVNEDGTFNIENVDVSTFGNGEIRVQIEIKDEDGNKALTYDSIRKQIVTNEEVNLEVQKHEIQDESVVISGTVNSKYYDEKVFAEFEDGTRAEAIINKDGTWEIKDHISKAFQKINVYTLHSDVISLDKPIEVVSKVSISGMDEDKNTTIYKIDENSIEKAKIEGSVLNGNTVKSLSITDGEEILVLDLDDIVYEGENFKLENIDVSSLKDGDLKVELITQNSLGNEYRTVNTIIKDTSINIEFDESSVDIYERSHSLYYDLKVNERFSSADVKITDIKGNEVYHSTLAYIDSFKYFSDIDISTLDYKKGLLLEVSAKDLAGNTIEKKFSYGISTDIEAKIRVYDDVDSNRVIDASNKEVEKVRLEGKINVWNDIDKLYITDGENKVEISSDNINIDDEGNFVIEDIDVSSLKDGVLTAQLEVSNIKGETKVATQDIKKDTKVNIVFDEENSKIEDTTAHFSGKVEDVEIGRRLTIIFIDQEGKTIRTTATVEDDSSWKVDQDISSLSGDIKAGAYINDSANNNMMKMLGVLPVVDDTPVVVEPQIDLILRGDSGYGHNESWVDQDEHGNGGNIYIEPNLSKGLEITKLTISDGYKEFSFNPPFDPSTKTYTTNLLGYKNGQIFVTLEAKDSFGNVSQTKEAISKITYTDVHSDIYELFIDNEIMYISGRSPINNQGDVFYLYSNDENGNQKSLTGVIIGKGGYWSSAVHISSLIDGVTSLSLHNPYIPDYSGYVQGEQTIETGILKSSVKAQVQIDDNDNILTEDENINISGNISKNSILEKLVLKDGNKEVELTNVIINEDGTFKLENIDVGTFGNGEIRVQIEVKDEDGNKALKYDSIRKQIATNEDVDLEVQKHEVQGEKLVISGTVNSKYYDEKVFVDFDNGRRAEAIINKDGTWEIKEYIGNISSNVNIYTIHSDVKSITVLLDSKVEAEIKIYDDEDSNKVIDASSKEVEKVKLEGKINIGNSIDKLYITDGESTTQINPNNINIDKEGNFVMEDIDVSSLKDGILTVQLKVSNGIGESKTVSQNIKKDTKANVILDEENSRVEDNIAYFSGKAEDIEAGKVITISFISQSGSNIRTTATVQKDSSWEVEQDVSSLSGNIKAMVYANDYSNNNVVKTMDLPFVESKQESIIDESETVDISKLIETQSLDLTNNKADTISLDLTEILDSTDADLELVINGELQDRIDLDESQWTKTESLSMNDEVYNSYESINSTSTIKLLIENEIEII